MDSLNGHPHILSSIYRGPKLYLDARKSPPAAEPKPEEEEPETPETTPEGEDPETPEAPPEGGEGGAGDEDPLTTPNPFKEGSSEHGAFEHQRAKFQKKLETERAAARKEAEADSAKKLDQILEAVNNGKPLPTTPETPPAPPEDDVEITDQDVKIVSKVMKQLGIDPHQMVQERRKSEVKQALTQLREAYPGVEFTDAELVRYANDSGISRMGGAVKDILELALVRSKGDAIRGTAKPAPATPPAPKPGSKKDPVPPISTTPTNAEPAPKSKGWASVLDWKNRTREKYAGK